MPTNLAGFLRWLALLALIGAVVFFADKAAKPLQAAARRIG